MQLTFLGGCREVGRAAFLLEDGRDRLLLDYGVKLNDETELPLPVRGALTGLIISHAHLDHCGAAPLLFKTSECPCYMTPPSLPLIDLLVKDSIKIARLEGLEQIFSTSHLKRMIRNVIPADYRKQRSVGSWQFEFRDAGHILGAASVVAHSKKHSLAFTGDIKLEQTTLHSGADYDYKADVLITESTYGTSDHPERKALEKQFVEECKKVCDNNGNVLVPAFAVGRAQEIVTMLHNHKFGYPVYLDGMAKQAAEIMFDFPEYLRDFRQMYSALKAAEWASDDDMRDEALDQPSVIVSTAGLLQGGPAIQYLFKMKDRPNQAVFFSGFQTVDSPGRLLLEQKRFKFEDFDMDYSEMLIKYFDFSAHAGVSELSRVVKKVSPKVTIVVHGEEPKAKAFAERIQAEHGGYVIVPKLGDRLNLEKYL